ncbi:Nicotinate-nucleotide adenylyltransferase [Urinicoccus massiliensis]|uniref:Probable nicotinate-nucleotide adenylyltransferase n=1 Tax=Urinicoccus massiliensis TaxID=1723382 RepID=A0A8H2M5S4_9FIRM|nr:nicotinate-nucleotide adenylyltransferase [Urinicoccus massiliensis]VFB15828.1 Nicotinate-nucleotide adenylyltransferase [Urinicoccus massiliensis]
MTKRYGIMGGSFNPIHMGHLMMSEYVRVELDLDEIIFIPTGNPPHKQKGLLDARDRLDMVKMAIRDNPHFSVSDMEIRRRGISYSVDTVQALKKAYPQDEFYFLIGLDILPDLRGWERFDELAKELEFALAIRPGFDSMNKEKMVWEINTLKEQFQAEIVVVETPLYEISSTDIRRRIREGKSIRYLVKEEIRQRIQENGYYKG